MVILTRALQSIIKVVSQKIPQSSLRFARTTQTRPNNILLTHHHPQQVTELAFDDQSTMIGGDRLVVFSARVSTVLG